MRMIGYLFVIGLLLLLAAGPGQWAWQGLDRQELAAYLSGQLEGAQPSNTHLQRGDNWLEFQLSGNGSSVHVVSNARVQHAQVSDNDTVWWYAFHYQLLDSDGELLREGEYHHRTHVTRYREPRQGRMVTRTFLLDPRYVPTDGRRMVLPFLTADRPARLRLHVSHTDPALLDVMFRVYEKETVAARKLDHRWQRLNEAGKQVLARGSVYGPDHLRSSEQQNLLRSRWRPLGPGGVKGNDYLTRKVYVQRSTPGEQVDDAVLPSGLYVDVNTNGIIPLPQGGGRIRLQWTPTTALAGTAADEQILLHWYGRNLGQRSQTSVPLADPQGWLAADFGEGLLEVVSRHPVVIHAFLDGNETMPEITPEATRLRAYLPDESLSLVYKVDHVGDQLTPLRIDVRTILTAADTLQQPIHFEILDAAGKPLAAGDLHQDATPSRYDRLVTIEPGVRLSEPARNYFNLPAAAAELRINTTGSALITAYTRPADLMRELRYPEDLVYAQLNEQDGLRQPAWFVLQPANERELLASLHTQNLLLQNRPPVDDPRLLAGQYSWEDYQPDGEWRGRHLLLPREGGLPLRDLSRGAVYGELPANRETTVELRDFTGHRELRPTLIFQREQEQPAVLEVLLDGNPWHETRITGRSGQLLLPIIPAGKHRVLIQGPDTARWFMNYLDVEGASYVRRLATQVGPDGLEFRYHKQTAAAEVLTGQLYQRQGNERMRLHVEVEHETGPQLKPLVDWTFVQRIYDLHTADATRVAVLNTDSRTVDSGRRFFVRLGTDLPPGNYRIRIRAEQDAEAYLALYRLLPGQQLVRLFLRERGYVD
jgi:hypothetical protein